MVTHIHQIHIFKDGSFAESLTVKGTSMVFQSSDLGKPNLILNVDDEIQKILNSKDRNNYRYDHKQMKFVIQKNSN